jgi:hypothetical protein
MATSFVPPKPDQWEGPAQQGAQVFTPPPPSAWEGKGQIDYSKPPEQSNLSKAGNAVRDAFEGVGAGVVSSGVGLYNAARKIPGAEKIMPPVSATIQAATQPPDRSGLGWPGQAGKTAEQVGEFMIPGGAISRGAKAIEGATAGMRAAPILNTVGRAALEGASAAGVTGVQTGGNTGEIAKAGLTAGAVSGAIPAVGSLARKVGPAILGKTTGAGEEAIRTAATNPSPEFMKAMRGGTDEGEIVGSFRDALGKVKEARGEAYRQQLAQISQQQSPPIDITPVRQQLMQKLGAFRVKVTPQGPDFSRSVIPKSEQGTVEAIANDVIGWDDYTPLGVDALKRRIGNYYSPTSDVRALTSTVENATKKVLHANVPGYSEMTQDYANASDFITKVEQEMALGPRSQQGAAIRRISYALKQNNEYRKALAEALDQFTQSDLKGQLAGYHLKDTLPKGLTGVASGVGILGAIGLHALSPDAAVAMMASSPRLVGETLAAMSKLRGAGPAIAGAIPKASAAFSVNRDKPVPQFASGGIVTPNKKRHRYGPPKPKGMPQMPETKPEAFSPMPEI